MKQISKYITIFFCISLSGGFSYSQDSSIIVQDTVLLETYSRKNLDTNNFNIFPKLYTKKKIALVLSGGGARGISQLGVLAELEKHDVRIDMIVGTSIGSLIGGLYSSGYDVNEIRNMLNDLNWDKALSLTNKYQRTSLFLEQKKIQDRSLLTIPLDGIKPVLLPSSLSNGLFLSEKINSFILNSRYHPKNNFSDLKTSFAAVATDLDNGEKVILNKGNLSESIKASLTFPLLYTPIIIDGRNLVDGGLSANIPNDVAKTLGADLTIVVNTTSPLKSNEELNDPINTADQILSIAMEQLNHLQLTDANIVITPDLQSYSSNDFSKLNYLISKGEQKTQELINVIKTELDSLELSESKYFNNFVINPKIEVISNFYDPRINDTLEILTDRNFEKYTAIEKNLKMMYKTGVYSKVYATVTRIGLSATIAYNLTLNPLLENVVLKDSNTLIDSLVDNFRKNNIYKPVNVYHYTKFYNDLLGVFRRNNYSLIDIDKFYFEHSNNSLIIEFSSGKIRNVELTGNKVTNDNVIFREIDVDKTEPVRKKNLDISIKNVMSTNLFRQVSFEYAYNKKFTLPALKVKLIEKNTKALRFSLKVDNERNLQLLLDIRDENILGSAVEVGALAAGGLRNRIYQLEIKSNQFFNLPLTFNYNLYYTFRDINGYTQSIDFIDNKLSVNKIGEYRDVKYGMSFLFGTQLERFGTIYGQVFAENQQIKNKFDSENLSEELRVIKLKFGGIFDTQDRLPFPTKGILINFYYETAKNISEGNFSYIKFFTGYEQYFSIAKSQTLKPRFIFGFGDRTAPLTEQFSLGGEKSFFGMLEDELRGRQILSTSLEYRYMLPYKIFFDTYFILRYDLGNVWQVSEDIRFKDLRHGIGFTTAFDTPIGEASFSVGKSFIIKKGLTEDSFIFGPYNFYFSIGYDI